VIDDEKERRKYQAQIREKDFDICNIKLNMKEMEGKLQAYE